VDVTAARREALDRSLLLFAGLLDPALRDDQLDAHLAGFRVRIVATDAGRLTQLAVTTIAALVVRSGMPVIVDMPDQPTLTPLLGRGSFFASLDAHVRNSMPGAALDTGGHADLIVAIGPAAVHGDTVWVGAGPTASMCGSTTLPWHPGNEITALGAAALAATEVHKAALRGLPARNRTARRILEPSSTAFEVGTSATFAPDIGALTIVSAGAITNAALWTLLSIPDLAGHVRVWDEDRVSLSNLNRCLLFGMTQLDQRKVDVLAGSGRERLTVEGIPRNFQRDDPVEAMVLVGADRVEARHDVQSARPPFLVVGATEGAGVVLVSEHAADNPCAACLHPLGADDGARVPTASFVSFWAGYFAAGRLLRAVDAGPRDPSRQVTRCYPLQPQSTVDDPATRRQGCEVCGGAVTA
jgi:hypothetical protein